MRRLVVQFLEGPREVEAETYVMEYSLTNGGTMERELVRPAPMAGYVFRQDVSGKWLAHTVESVQNRSRADA